MKIINQALDDPVARVSNEVIGGLCHLVMTEVRKFVTRSIHIQRNFSLKMSY